MSQFFFKELSLFVLVINIKNETFLRKLGRRIIILRHEKGLSQEELANLSDIPVAQVGRIERGRINCTISTLLTISKGLGVNLSYLLEFDYDIID